MSKRKNENPTTEEAKELRGRLRKVFAEHSADKVLKSFPRHIQLKDRNGELIKKVNEETIFDGIHSNMLKRDFDAIAKMIKKFEPKHKSAGAERKERYRQKAEARRHNSGMS